MRTPALLSGLDVLLEDPAPLRGRRIGLVANPASVTSRYVPTARALLDAGLDVRVLFGPEHGLTGAVQDMLAVGDGDTPPGRLPVVSLYGERFEDLPGLCGAEGPHGDPPGEVARGGRSARESLEVGLGGPRRLTAALQVAGLRADAALIWTVILVASFLMVLGFGRAGSTLFWKSHATGEPAEPDHSPEPMAFAAIGGLLAGLILLTVFAGPVKDWLDATAAALHAPTAYIGANNLPGVN